jgi:6-phosphogluconolactonase
MFQEETMQAELAARRELALFENRKALSRDAAYRFVALAAQSAQAGRPFTVALSGGSTPEMLYRLLAAPPFRDSISWPNVHLFFGDERCVPPDAPESNYRMAHEALIAPVSLPPENVHRMPGENADPEAGAQQYAAELRQFFNLAEGERPRFDLVLLGMGPDGHCASLFPHKPALQERQRLVVASEPGLKPFVPRLTLTLPVLNNAAHVLFLVAGADKAETLARVLEGPTDFDALPSQSVAPTNGTLTWLLDRDAARQLRAFTS